MTPAPRLLLDTHVVIRQLTGARELSVAAQGVIEQAAEPLFSVVSYPE